MILPKEFFDKIEYFEHTMEHKGGTNIYDKFVIHFKAWWRPSKVIKIHRRISYYDEANDTLSHHPTESAADLYNQLNDYATDTFQEKLNSMTRKYETNETDNVITLKPRPKDMDDDD